MRIPGPLGLQKARAPSGAPRTFKSDCIFCQIVKNNDKLVKTTKNLVAFEDIKPAAAAHYLVVPREHIDGLYDLEGARDLALLDEMVELGREVVAEARAARGARAGGAAAGATSTSTSASASTSSRSEEGGAEATSRPSTSTSDVDDRASDVKLGFHIPPWNSVDHLHLHAFLLPHTDAKQRVRFLETPFRGAALWYATAEQVRARVVSRMREKENGSSSSRR